MTRTPTPRPAVQVPLDYPSSTIFMDESGSRANSSRFFVMSAVKVREVGQLLRAVRTVRDRNRFASEFKFSEITQGSICAYYDLIDQVADSDAHLAACVVNRDVFDPFHGPGTDPWRVHADVAAQLLIGCINRRELVGLLMDGLSTPTAVSLEDVVRQQVNRRLGATSIVSAVCCDSKTNDGIQIADVVAGAISFDRRRQLGHDGRRDSKPSSPKAKVARRLMEAFSLDDFSDDRQGRINIATLRSRHRSRPSLHVISDTSA